MNERTKEKKNDENKSRKQIKVEKKRIEWKTEFMKETSK